MAAKVRHFKDRFFPKWANIYAIGDKFNEAEFAENWIDPEKFSLSSSPIAALSAVSGPTATSNADTSQGSVALLDPSVLIKDCVNITRNKKGQSSANLNTSVFNEKYKDKRFKYVGTVHLVQKFTKIIIFQGGGKFPSDWHVEFALPADRADLLKTLQKGQQLTIEGDVSELVTPIPDVPLFGLGRAIRLKNTKVLEQ